MKSVDQNDVRSIYNWSVASVCRSVSRAGVMSRNSWTWDTSPSQTRRYIKEISVQRAYSLVSWCNCSCLNPMRWLISCNWDQSEGRDCSVDLYNIQQNYFAHSLLHISPWSQTWDLGVTRVTTDPGKTQKHTQCPHELYSSLDCDASFTPGQTH